MKRWLQRMAAAPPSPVGADMAMVMGGQMVRLERMSEALAAFCMVCVCGCVHGTHACHYVGNFTSIMVRYADYNS